MAHKNKGGRPLKFKSVAEVEKKINSYFDSCFEDVKGEDGTTKRVQIRPYTITGLANALDTNRQTLLNYEKNEQFFDTIKAAKSKVEQYVEEYLFLGRNQTGAIFNLKNNYEGWKDKNETELSNPDGNLKTINIIKTNSENGSDDKPSSEAD